MLTTQGHSKVCNHIGRDEKRGRHKKRGLAERAGYAAANGFLKHAFAPVIGRELGLLGQPRQVEWEFFNSLSNLALLYGLDLTCKDRLAYPLNIAQAFEEAKKQFGQKRKELDLVILNDTTHKACIATAKAYDTGNCLYYIAVKPLQLLFGNPRCRVQANLLLSIFSYLHQIAGIPDFSNGFLGGEYEMIYEWFTEEERSNDEDDCYDEIMEAYKAMRYYGKKLFKSIGHVYHLQQFEHRVRHFKPVSETDKELHAVGIQILELYKQYPTRSIFDYVCPQLDETEREERVLADQYISFFWEGEGLIYHQLIETVNTRFQETTSVDEPTALQYFDQQQIVEKHDLSFEETFFDCIDHLAEVLNEIK